MESYAGLQWPRKYDRSISDFCCPIVSITESENVIPYLLPGPCRLIECIAGTTTLGFKCSVSTDNLLHGRNSNGRFTEMESWHSTHGGLGMILNIRQQTW